VGFSALFTLIPLFKHAGAQWKKCGECKKKCPYGLDTPALLEKNLDDYERFYSEFIHGK
jgi:predicted aldo/keto reductase-like oxidoreductase